MSKRRKLTIRDARRKLGKCPQCGAAPVEGARVCERHLLMDRARKQRTGGFKGRVAGGRGRPCKTQEGVGAKI
jgi:hypothetical protein